MPAAQNGHRGGAARIRDTSFQLTDGNRSRFPTQTHLLREPRHREDQRTPGKQNKRKQIDPKNKDNFVSKIFPQ